MSKRKRPYWQHTPCPAWCGGHHSKYDHDPDRRHSSSWYATVTLSLEDPDEHRYPDGGYGYSKPQREVYVAQGYREVEPRIGVEGGPPNSGRNFDLTVGEALALIKALTTAVDVAEGHTTGGV